MSHDPGDEHREPIAWAVFGPESKCARSVQPDEESARELAKEDARVVPLYSEAEIRRARCG